MNVVANGAYGGTASATVQYISPWVPLIEDAAQVGSGRPNVRRVIERIEPEMRMYPFHSGRGV